jgi:hypothetical protein
MHTTNGNGAATAAPRVINGRGIAHRHADKRRRAILAADLADGHAVIQLSTRQLAHLLGVSETYIRLAQRFSPEKRRAILAGRNSIFNFWARRPPALSAPRSVSDQQLTDLAHLVGPDRWLNAGVRARI